jgi:ABC-type sugar transport system permease subunit
MLTQPTSVNPPPAELRAAPYQLLEVIEHSQIVGFVQRYMRFSLKRPFVLACWLLNVGLAAWVGGSLFFPGQLSLWERLSFFALGMVAFLLILLPLHELLHAAVYRILGARNIIIEAHWRTLVFMALADGFVVNARQFYWVALTPFGIINTLLLLLLIPAGESLQWLIYGVLVFHTSGCTGDFALCSFVHQHRHLSLYTYDDYASGKSYFYGYARVPEPFR